jgi:glutamate-1-semialdehyde 2,1-aminomutase
MNLEAQKVLVDGGSHALRLIQPFPPRITAAQGAWVRDEDGHDILDFWQGHHTNILGHNPETLTAALEGGFKDRFGLQTGFTDHLQVEVAEILYQQTQAERVRFTTSGSLATMYATLLARAFTGRELVMKVGGGWHGAQPWGLKGVGFHANKQNSFQHVDSAGLTPAMTDEVLVSRYNDPNMLQDHFKNYGDQIACFIVEPFIGAGGYLPAKREYLQVARELTYRYGVVLIFDEIISAFRFRAGDAGTLYGLRPDLATFGKIIGGGMPLSAVAGRAEIMDLVGRGGSSQVKFSGGTFSGHPASLLAAKTLLETLISKEREIYPRLGALGQKARQIVEAAFAEEGICARCTGYPNDALAHSSISMLHFPYREDCSIEGPEEIHNPDICDQVLREKIMRLALLLENVHVVHGLGSVTTAHTEADIELLGEACRRVARTIKEYL